MKGFLIILSFLIDSVVPLPNQLQHKHVTRRLLNGVAVGKNQPPKAMKVKHEMEMFGDVRNDDYIWLQDDNGTNPQVLSYINKENNYTDLIMSDTKYLQDQIYAEMRGQIQEDITAPRRRGPYYYYERTSAESDYYKYCRRLAPNGTDQRSIHDVMPTGSNSPPENVLLDVNLRAKGHKYYYVDAFEVSPNDKLVAYTENTEGDQNYTANVINAESKQPVGKSLVGLSYNLLWAGNETLLYITMDDTKRQDKVGLQKLGEEPSNDLCLYHEKNSNFSVNIDESENKKFIFVGSRSVTTSFTFYFDIAHPKRGLLPLTPCIDGIFTSVSHHGTQFIIKRWSDEIFFSELLACPVDNVSAVTVIILPHRESVQIKDIQLFSGHIIVFERENGLTKIAIFSLPTLEEPIQILQTAQAIEFIDPICEVYQTDSEFYSSILRFSYSAH